MQTHVKILGILQMSLGALGLIGGFIALAVMGGLAGLVGATDTSEEAWVAVPILGGLGAIAFLFAMVMSIPGLIAGWGLLNYKPWARILTIVLSVIGLFNVPFGTALGIYGLWVMLSAETERLFARSSAAPF